MRMQRATTALAAVLVAMAAVDAAADDSCPLAGNGICEEIYLGPGYCLPATDSTDCAQAEVLPASDERELNEFDIRYLTPYALRLARNEIFARHGYRFNSEDLQAFFSARSWYRPTGQDVTLSEIEQANVNYLRRVEDGAIDPWAQRSRAPSGTMLPPWTAWIGDVVHADGRVQAGVVDGVRGRVTDRDTTDSVLVRVDMEDALHFNEREEDVVGVSVWWGMFPPVLLEPYVQGLRIVPQPVGRETVGGEEVTRVRLDWSDGGARTLHGEALLTDDGIFIEVDVEGVFTECCGGEELIPWHLEYRLENLERGRREPSLLEPPPLHQWNYAG